MKSPKTIWIMWDEGDYQELKQGMLLSCPVFLSAGDAKLEARGAREAGYKVRVSKYERSK